ncbi:uncharacterized protein GGS22DRAFT_158419 [Annulohypoxylon maeteangense]|uniref:uncharacterized protein n=1 Tax=Annulohypoxylon maeteangense TaxID=1927788 RepID=UPI0020074AD1|nr:uncharacterized protein GGS22DRAFT_158419 [Annulohypoxylon maeteangense]KAI0886674.1 hypothetical protein GGS22DRAFT_158419 [Annulohypoxylon maeteangense]
MASDHPNMDIKKSRTDPKLPSPSNPHARRSRVFRKAYIGASMGAVLAYAIFVVLYITRNSPLPFWNAAPSLPTLITLGSVVFLGFLCPIFFTRDGYNLVWMYFCCRQLGLMSTEEYKAHLEGYLKERP